MDYITEAMKTKSDKLHPELVPPDVRHAIEGVCNEAGEMMKVLKKADFGGKIPDYVNLDEEFGDNLWFIALYCHSRGITLEDLMRKNIAKLRARHGEKF